MLFHILRHVNADHCILITEQLRQVPGRNSVFPTPVGPRNIKEPVGRFGSLRPTATPYCFRYGGYGFLLTYYPLMKGVFHAEQSLRFVLSESCDRNAGPWGDNSCYIVHGYFAVCFTLAVLPLLRSASIFSSNCFPRRAALRPFQIPDSLQLLPFRRKEPSVSPPAP